MRAAGKATAGFQSLSGGEVGIEDVEKPVPGMRSRCDIPGPEVRGICGDPDPSPEPAAARHEVGAEPVLASVDERGSEVDPEPLSLCSLPAFESG